MKVDHNIYIYICIIAYVYVYVCHIYLFAYWFDWWIDWLLDSLIDWLIDRSIDWLIDSLIDWLTDNIILYIYICHTINTKKPTSNLGLSPVSLAYRHCNLFCLQGTWTSQEFEKALKSEVERLQLGCAWMVSWMVLDGTWPKICRLGRSPSAPEE